jgi:hypothetical protein
VPRDSNFQMVMLRADEVADHAEEMGRNAVEIDPVWAEIDALLEADEARHFRMMRGRYVLTGVTMASLTQATAIGAIREHHGAQVNFGTDVRQAHYLTKSPHDKENFQVRKHNGKGRSAVLVLRPVTVKRAAKVLLHHVAKPWGRR